MTEWRWVAWDTILATHDWLIAEHGGLDGIRDEGLVESALSRPKNLHHYDGPDAATLAAAYAFGFVRNHGFMDGNKRIGWVAARLFLADNGIRFSFSPIDAVRTMEAVASGSITEQELSTWFRARMEGALGDWDRFQTTSKA